MATRVYTANRSSLLADPPSGSALGGGADKHLPIGAGFGGYGFRSVIDWPSIDWSDVGAITLVRLRLWVTSGVHADPASSTIRVQRVTAQWSPNGNSSSADSPPGSGWGTSGAVYGSVSTTTAGQVSESGQPTAAGSYTDIDVTAIVRSWAPATVAGGGGQPKYGVEIAGTAGANEFESAKAGNADRRPDLIIDYTVAAPTAPTFGAPTGKIGSTRPGYSFTSSHPAGAPLTVWDLEDRPAGGGVEYAPTNRADGIAGYTVSHGAEADLTRGPREVRARVQAAGVWSAWSGWHSYAIDRLPVVGAWSAPPASVTGTRRPVHTFAVSDADADAVTAYDLEVYAASGGAPVGTPVYAPLNQTAGISGGSVSHTPTVDLPGGQLVARARVLAGGAWSAWSAYHAYTVVTANPSVQWLEPQIDCGYLPATDPSDLTKPLGALLVHSIVASTPPAGQTLTRIVVEHAWSPGGYTVLYDGPPGNPAGGTDGAFRTPAADGVTPFGSGFVKFTVHASGGGVTVVERQWRAALFEYVGSMALGDQVAALAVPEFAHPGVDSVLWLRAQSSPTAAAGGAPWRQLAQIATVQAELPATNAYLGVRMRAIQRAIEVDALGGSGSFEGAQGTPPGWSAANGFEQVADARATDGTMALNQYGSGTFQATTSPVLDVIPGAPYVLVADAAQIAGAAAAPVVQLSREDGTSIVQLRPPGPIGGPLARASAVWIAPADGSIKRVRIYCFAEGSQPPGARWTWDRVRLVGPAPTAGLDRLRVAWTSLG